MPVNTPSEEFKDAKEVWETIEDVLDGARSVKSKGRKYLPILDRMSHYEYEAYKNRAQFFNATARTVNGLVGLVFRKAPNIILGAAETLRPNLNSCTVDGLSFSTFARSIFRQTLSYGRVGALVDAPAQGGLPYFTTYDADDIINWRKRKFPDGKIMADQIILEEDIMVPRSDGFGSEEIEIFRELVLSEDGIYVQRVYYPVKGLDGVTRYELRETVAPTISGLGYFRNEIPFVVFGPHSTGVDIQKSPIEDIAELNILHYQRSAQLAHGQFYTATPTYWAVPPNNGETPEYVVGPNTVWLVDQPHSCGILEYRGEGLKYLESACTQLENQMAGLGARLVANRANTAAESRDVADMRSKGETSLLFEIVDSVESGLTDLLKVWVRWQGRDPRDVQVKLNRDFVGSALEYRTWLQLDRAHEKGDIDDATYYGILFEGDVLPASFTHEDVKRLVDNAPATRARKQREVARAEAEAAEALAEAQNVDIQNTDNQQG